MFSASNLLAAARFFLQDICRDSGESLQLRQACLFAADRDKKSDINNGTATDDADDDDETMLELDRCLRKSDRYFRLTDGLPRRFTSDVFSLAAVGEETKVDFATTSVTSAIIVCRLHFSVQC
ncbi:unnamed protein product [Sphagnum jensenii]